MQNVEPAADPWWARTGLLVLLVIAINAIFALLVVHFPFQDVPNHIARYQLIDRAWFGVPAAYVHARFAPGPYIGADLLGVALVHLFGPRGTQLVLGIIVATILPLGFLVLARAVSRTSGTDLRAWTLAAAPLGLAYFSCVGFINYDIGLGCTLAWLGCWWSIRAGAPRWPQLLVLAIGSAVLFMIHLSSPLITIVVIGADWLVEPASRRRKFATVATTVATFILMFIASLLASPAVPAVAGGGATRYGSVLVKLRNLLTPFFVFSFSQLAVTLGCFVVAVGLLLYINRPVRRWNTLAAGVNALLLAYAVTPANTPGTGYTDMRWLLPAFLLLLLAIGDGVRTPPPWTRALLFGLAVVNAISMWATTRPIERELADAEAVIAQIPPNRRLLPIVADGQRHGPRVFPYRHLAFWYQIERGGRVPAMFNFAGDGGGAPAQRFMSHFIVDSLPYSVPPEWGTTQFTPLDWSAIARDYDYILVEGADARVAAEVRAHAQPIASRGEVVAYAIDGAAR